MSWHLHRMTSDRKQIPAVERSSSDSDEDVRIVDKQPGVCFFDIIPLSIHLFTRCQSFRVLHSLVTVSRMFWLLPFVDDTPLVEREEASIAGRR